MLCVAYVPHIPGTGSYAVIDVQNQATAEMLIFRGTYAECRDYVNESKRRLVDWLDD